MTDYPHLKIVGGLYLPNTDPGNWLTRGGMTEDGYAKYQYDRIEEAVRLCGSRLRTCVDGGAHIGSWTVHLAKRFKLVHAFEPIHANFECLGLNTRHLPNVALHPYAVSDRQGQVRMLPTGGKSFQWAVANNPGAIEIDAVPIDNLNLRDCDLLKLDVEGHEFEALTGAANTLHRCRPVVVIEEKHDETRRASNYLRTLGMELIAQMKHDLIFQWPS